MKNWIVPIACLVTGTVIYLLFRKDIMFMSWVGVEGRHVDVSDSVFREWVVYSLPDGLWYMALLLAELEFTQRRCALSIVLFAIAVIFPFVLEILQLTNIIPGTFDWLDIATYCLTLIIFTSCKRKKLYLLSRN